MNTCAKNAIEKATSDMVFARILTAPEPGKAMRKLSNYLWIQKTAKLVSSVWVQAAIDAKNGIFKDSHHYSNERIELEEIEVVQNHFRRFNEYADLLAGISEKPFSDYLYGISVEDFRALLQHKRGMDAAREIQLLYKKGALAEDLGGSQLHRYMEQMGLPYIPTINHLNAARRGEITKGRYNMTKSRAKQEKLLKFKNHE